MAVRDVVQAAAGVGGGDELYVEDVFSTYLYTGNGSTQTITNGIDLAGEGGMVWFKARNQIGNNAVFDTDRGGTKFLKTNGTDGNTTRSNLINSFNSDGFTLGNGDIYGITNYSSSYNFASWTFRKAPKFFDVVTYVGTNDGVTPEKQTQTIAHNLGSVPGVIIVKGVDIARDWMVYHTSLGATKVIALNDNNIAGTNSTYWNNTEPTSTHFTVGGATQTNLEGYTYVAYIFAHNAGGFGDDGEQNVISCGSFITDGSGLGSVNLGWEPQWLLVKNSSNAGSWVLMDTMRGMTNTGSNGLFANLTNAESVYTSANLVPTATGFDLRSNLFNANDTLIYIAIRRGPMRTPESGGGVLGLSARTGTGVDTTVTGGSGVTDLAIIKNSSRTLGARWLWASRLTGIGELSSDDSDAEAPASTTLLQANPWDVMDGIKIGVNNIVNNSSFTYINYLIKRAPGFFDVVAYTGTGVARTLNHNLGVAPELIIVKSRTTATGWYVYNVTIGNSSNLILNKDEGAATSSPTRTVWNNTSPTSSVFSVGGTGWNINDSGQTYIAYLFATLAGVSKVGSYTGTGTTQAIDCGFSSGARFVLIKRTDGPAVAGNGDWYVWDSARGIVASNDPYLLLNSADDEVTNTDYIDPLSSGFTVTSSAPAALNASGGSYIFLAIA